MLGRGNAPARTEADIRAALTELAQRAPSTDDVLAAVRDARALGQQGPPRAPGLPGTRRMAARARWLRWPQLAVAFVAATVAIVLAVMLTPGSEPVRGRGSVVLPPIGSLTGQEGTASPSSVTPVVSPGREPPTVLMGKAMLAAFSAATSYVVAETIDYSTNGHPAGSGRFWSWPAEPSPGQVEYARSFWDYPAVRRGGAKLIVEIGYTAVVPRPSPYGQNSYARVVVVCYAGSCGYGRRDVPVGTWWTRTGMFGYMDFTPSPGGAELAHEVASGMWRILGHARVRGQQAIKLTETRTGHFMPRPVVLWVSTTTYLPLRMDWLSRTKTGEVDNWYYRPPTKANLAQLSVPIPAGYRRSG